MGVSSIISNLITVFPRSVLTAVPSELFASFVNCLTHLTCSFGRSAALEEVVSDGPVPGSRPACGRRVRPRGILAHAVVYESVFSGSLLGNVTFKYSWIEIILVD